MIKREILSLTEYDKNRDDYSQDICEHKLNEGNYILIKKIRKDIRGIRNIRPSFVHYTKK